MILYFLRKHFADKDSLITPMKPLQLESDEEELAAFVLRIHLRKTIKY